MNAVKPQPRRTNDLDDSGIRMLVETAGWADTGAGAEWFELCPDGLIIADAAGVVRQANAAAVRMCGAADAAALVGGLLADLISREDAAGVMAGLRSRGFTGRRTAPVETELLRADGGTVLVEMHAAAGLVGGRPTVQVVLRELRERRGARGAPETRFGRLSALRTVDAAITGSLDLRVALGVLLDQVTGQLHVDAAGVLLVNPFSQKLEYAIGRGFRTETYRRTNLPMGTGPAGRAAMERRTIGSSDLGAGEETAVLTGLIIQEQFLACYSVPLIAKGRVKGVLEVFHRAPIAEADQNWLDFLEALAGQAAIAIDNASLYDELQRMNTQLTMAYDATLEGWVRALDMRDRETEGHTQRVTEMTCQLARRMGLGEAEMVHVRRGALLHDIGKMGMPDRILHKPGPLDAEEWVVMRKHPVYAHEMLAPIPFLKPAIDIPFCHHEKWDGGGYPRGLKGEEIPFAARLFAVVDIWDALRSDRPYRKGWPAEQVLEHIRSLSGTHLDPRVVEAFLALVAEPSAG